MPQISSLLVVAGENATTQRSTLLLETVPTQLMAVGKTLYFVMGTTQVVYKIAID